MNAIKQTIATVCASFAALAIATPGQPGTLDASWATLSAQGAGKLLTSFGNSNDVANALLLQPDGKVIQVGHCNASTNGSVLSVCIARFLPGGAPDTSFNATGQIKTTYAAAPEFGPVGAALRGDGKLVVAGRCAPAAVGQACLLRYTSSGALDSSFGNAGIALGGMIGSTGMSIYNMALQPDGKIIVVGTCQGTTTYDFCVQRFTADGAIDAGFNASATGSLVLDMNANFDYATSALVQSDGKIVIAGGCSNGGVYLYCVLRLLANGSIDSSFGQSGKLLATPSGGAQAVAVQPDGKLILAGQCAHTVGQFLKGDFCILRFNANGAVDSGFGSAGQVLTTVGNYGNMAYSIAVQPDGRIVVAGSCGNGGNNSAADICVQRFTPEGALDTTFNGTGYVITPIGSGGFYFLYSPKPAVALYVDGRIMVGSSCPGGSGDYDFCSVRYDGGPFGYRACSNDLDGDGRVLATTDALMLARVALGMTGGAVTAGISFPVEASRTSWTAVRDYLVNQCGMALP